MLDQMSKLFIEALGKYGAEGFGYLFMALCFGMFFLRSTQKKRFHFISTGCYLLASGCFLYVILPVFSVLNPNFLISPRGYQIIQTIMVSSGCAFLLASLFVEALGKKALFLCALVLFVLNLVFIKLGFSFFPEHNPVYLMLVLSWIIVGISFHILNKVGKTSLFERIGDSFFVLAIYYVLRELNYISGTGVAPVFIFGMASLTALMAQVRFMESAYLTYEINLEKEKQRRTEFWDIAPFPILVSKLLDDSVIYINPEARKILGVSSSEIFQFHLKDYFTDVSKRDELILLTRKERIVDHFNVQMKSPRTSELIWLNISARVVELDGELALYMNLEDITGQKETEERLFKEASTDALTGLYNRRQFEAMSSMALANCIRQKIPYSMMMLDIDHFKHVNDTYGHDMGDVVLKNVAEILIKTHRDSDIVARYGGEEFIVFLSNTDADGAKIAAERVRLAVEKAVIMAGDTQVPITISLGITNTQNGDIYAMTKEADIALYHSKENGRNQATLFTEEMRGEEGANT